MLQCPSGTILVDSIVSPDAIDRRLRSFYEESESVSTEYRF